MFLTPTTTKGETLLKYEDNLVIFVFREQKSPLEVSYTLSFHYSTDFEFSQ